MSNSNNDNNSQVKYRVTLSLLYPGQCFSGFGADVLCDSENKTLNFQLTDDRHTEFKCPKIMLTFRQIEKKSFFKKIQVWVADVKLENCHGVYEDDRNFLGSLSVLKKNYETILTIHLVDKKHRLHRQSNDKWSYNISFHKKEDADKVLANITTDLKVPLKETTKLK